MSTNLRKAQKHMQRARELLNPESQLGFGTLPVQQGSNQLSKLADKHKQHARSWFESLPLQIRNEFITKDFECAKMCHLAQGSKQLLEEIGPICEKCSEKYRNAFNNLVRLKSLSEELMEHLLAKLNQAIIKTENAPQSVGSLGFLKYLRLEKIRLQSQKMDKIDVVFEIQEVQISKNMVYLIAVVKDDKNGNYTNETESKEAIRTTTISLQNIGTEQEFWSVHCFRMVENSFTDDFKCTSDLKWKEMEKWLSMPNPQKHQVEIIRT